MKKKSDSLRFIYVPVWTKLRNFLMKSSPRWVIFLIDLVMVGTAFLLAYTLRFNFDIYQIHFQHVLEQMPYILLFATLGFLLFKPYRGVVRHTGWHDIKVILKSTFSLMAMMLIATFLARNFFNSDLFNYPLSVSILTFILSTLLLVITRLLYKAFFYRIISSRTQLVNYLIYGTGLTAIRTYELLSSDINKRYINHGFIAEKPEKSPKKIQGISIYTLDKIDEKFLLENNIRQIIVATHLDNPLPVMNKLIKFRKMGIELKIIPKPDRWVDKFFKVEDIQDLDMEKLLHRQPIPMDDRGITETLQNKIVLVTGAAGSIGRELVKQIIHYKPRNLILVDFAESPLYELEMELLAEGYKNFETILADITNKEEIEKIFKHFHPDMIFHSAAYKHVPMLEKFPCKAIVTNILATKNLMETSIRYQVEKFVQISTDKAVNPTNVMGATKRVAELLARCLYKLSKGKTQFIITRFGNVLGSNGSVIKLFQKQIQKGGPVTVTHPDITRYFMTIPEAAHLVLKATEKGKGGEIFVFDMGEPVKIIDLARQMIFLAGKQYPDEIEIKIIGLRPGEKIYEELLTKEEHVVKTDYDKLYISKLSDVDCEYIMKEIEVLEKNLFGLSEMEIVKILKRLVPEFKSNASKYQKLDE